MEKYIEPEMKAQFRDHQAKLKDLGDIQILDWKKPGTSAYRIRYVFDGYMMYVSGDLGEAVFELTWKANVYSFDDVSIQYFAQKLKAYCEDRWNFSNQKAVKRLQECLKDIKSDGVTYDHNSMHDLFQEARDCSTTWEWAEIVRSHEDWISELDQDYWEWLYDIGNEYPAWLQSYLVGLKMASRQLKTTTKTVSA